MSSIHDLGAAHRQPASAPTKTILGWAGGAFLLSWAVFAVSVWLVRQPPAWYTFEFCQYAEIGRNLAERGRYETRVIEPMALAYVDRYGRADRPEPGYWPVVNRYPLPAMVIGGLFRIFGPSDVAAACSNGLAAALLAGLTVGLARAWIGRLGAALVGLLFLTNPALYGAFLLLGTPDLWFAVGMTAELAAWSRLLGAQEADERLRWGLAAGLLGGLAYLARFNMGPVLAVQVVVLGWRRDFRGAAAMTLMAGLVMSPAFIENYRQFGRWNSGVYSSWNLLDEIGAYRVEPWLYYQLPSIGETLLRHGDGVARKIGGNLVVIATRVWTLANLAVLLPLALAGLAIRAVRRQSPQVTTSAIFQLAAAGFFVVQLLAFSAMRLELTDRLSPHHGRYFIWYAPAAILGAVGLLGRIPARRWYGVGLVVVLTCLQLAVYASTWRHLAATAHGTSNLGRDPIREMLAKIVPEGRVVASNQPQIVAWFCDRQAVSMPADPVELGRLNQRSRTPIDYIFLDMNFNAIMLDGNWHDLAAGRVTPGARLWEAKLLEDYEYVFPPRRTRPAHYVLLRRRGVPMSEFERNHEINGGHLH